MRNIQNKFCSKDDYLIFFVGDSITEGARATESEKTYTAVFANLLAKKYSSRSVVRYDGQRYPSPDAELRPLMTYGEPITIQEADPDKRITVVRSGIGGNTVRRMIARSDDFLGKRIYGRHADLFVISVGINDSLANDPKKYVCAEQYAKDLNELLDLIQTHTPDSDIVLMTPSYNDEGTSYESSVDEYAQKMIEIASLRDLPMIDLHKVWMEHLVIGGENYGQGDWLCGVVGDHCHPSDIGHASIAHTVFNSIFDI